MDWLENFEILYAFCTDYVNKLFFLLTVPRVRNADAVINAGQIEIVCNESCSFPDGKTNLTLACKQTLPEGNTGCICQSM